jgi:predicted HicB family RNase H-like nuclease
MKTYQSKAREYSRKYVKVIEWDPIDSCFVGSAPPIIGRSCHGETEAEVLRQLGPMVEEWVELFLAEGRPLPEETANREYSGKFLVRLKPELHKKAALQAMVRGLSLNQYVVETLENEYSVREASVAYGGPKTKKGAGLTPPRAGGRRPR